MKNSAKSLSNRPEEIRCLQVSVTQLTLENTSLKNKLAWFQRQLFGRKSELRIVEENPHQLTFAGLFPLPEIAAPITVKTIAAHQRRTSKEPMKNSPEDSGLRFDATQVPVEEILISVSELQGDDKDQYEIISMKATYRLAQRPGSYVILKYLLPVVKHKESQALISTPAPSNVLEKSVADVSFLAGLLIDKFLYHLPFYRQHQRIKASHIELSRATLTNLAQKAIALLEPIATAQMQSILQSRLLAMDETPIKAERKLDPKKPGMKTAWFWPILGDRNEIVFSFSTNRGLAHVQTSLRGFAGTLLTDGYAAYASYAKQQEDVQHAQCWAHARRYFERALTTEPTLANPALDFIAALYQQEAFLRESICEDENKKAHRQRYSQPIVNAFFSWCKAQLENMAITDELLLKALGYCLSREAALRVFLDDPQVPLDTNHLERALRVIPMGRKNWLFCWTELGAKQVGIIQSLLVTCKLQGVDPYDYLVDVLQRVSIHPASQVADLTPRIWKEKFAQNPLRSDVFK